jgi:hypothetical protein
MPSQRFALRIPTKCPQCQAEGTVVLQQVIRGVTVFLSWVCERCESEWAADGDPNFIERRTGQPDTRREPHPERRGPTLTAS